MRNKWGIHIAKFIAFAVVAFFIFSYAVMFLWNYLVPDLFDGKTITLGQSMGLLALSKLLLTPFGTGFCGGRGKKCRKSQWKDKFQEKYDRMNCDSDLSSD